MAVNIVDDRRGVVIVSPALPRLLGVNVPCEPLDSPRHQHFIVEVSSHSLILRNQYGHPPRVVASGVCSKCV